MYYYVPELDYFFDQYWKTRGEITIIHLNTPEYQSTNLQTQYRNDSIFSLLFNNGFDSTSYCTTFLEKTISNFSKPIISRIIVKKNRITPYLSNASVLAKNIFNFTEDEITLFDKLLEYRLVGTCDISELSMIDEWTTLSKYIYWYLDICGNSNYDSIDSLVEFTSGNSDIKTVLFGIYVSNEVHKKLKSSEIILNNEIVNLYLNRKQFVL